MAIRRKCLTSTAVLALLLAMISSSMPLAEAQSISSASAPVKRALLIGINKYKSTNIPVLRGAENDVEAAVLLLTTRFGFKTTDIRILVNANATRSAILGALNEMAKVSGPKDWIYIHFSGHGSQSDDMNGDEKDDGKDETIVPYDGRTDDVPDIIDDELGEVLGKFSSPSVVIALDACHSGTGTRGVAVRTRSIPKDNRKDIYRRLQSTTRAVIPLTAQRHILLSGAKADERALDAPIDNQYRGLFSYALHKTLASTEMNAAARDLIFEIESELNRLKGQMGLVNMPEPQLEAEEDRINSSIFEPIESTTSAESQSKRAWLEVEALPEGRILLRKAALMGATAGSIWLIYPPGELEFAPGNGMVSARVITLQDKDAVASLQPADQILPHGCRAIAVAAGLTAAEISVLMTSNSSYSSVGIQQGLQKLLPELKFVEPGDFAHFIIEISEQRCQIFGMAALMPLDDFKPPGTAETVQRIARQLTRAIISADLLSLENSASNIRIEVSTPAQDSVSIERSPRRVKVVANTKAPQFRVRNPGDARNKQNSLQLQVRVNTDCYITIVDVDQEGGINLLFPNEIQSRDYYPDGRIRGGETILLPDSLADENRARFNWDISLPPGIDTIRIFAAKELKTAERIRQYIRNIRPLFAAQRGELTQRSPFAQLRQDLVQAAVNRDIKVALDIEGNPVNLSPNLSGDWAAESITIVVAIK